MPAMPRQRTSMRVQDAAWEIFAERGLLGVTMEEIAARAGVAKTTVYRWWPNKSAVLMDALKEKLVPHVSFPDTGDARQDVQAQIEGIIDLFRSDTGRAYFALIAESVHDAEVASALRARYVTGQRQAAIDRLTKGVAQGQVAQGADLEVLVESLYGALYYRVLVSHTPIDRRYAHRLIDQIWPAVPRGIERHDAPVSTSDKH